MSVASKITLGTDSLSKINLNLVYPVTTPNGKTYYILDLSGNGTIGSEDRVNNTMTDRLMNNGSDTFNTQTFGAVIGVNDQRTTVINGITLVMPTISELATLYSYLGGATPTGWASVGNVYLSSSLVSANRHSYSLLTNTFSYTGTTGDSLSGYLILQVLVPPNVAPTGSLNITGTASQGQTIRVESALADADGMGAISYQWMANGQVISGATGPTLLLTQDMVGKAISAVGKYTDGKFYLESVTSKATSLIANVNDAPTGTLSIVGSNTQGQVLSINNTLNDLDGLGAVSFQWNASGVAIAGATGSTLTLGQAQVGKTITVTATYTDGQNTREVVTSAATGVVFNVNDAPTGGVRMLTQLNSPIVASTQAHFSENKSLFADTSTLADADGLGTLNFQWQRSTDGFNWSNVALATAKSYVLVDADVNKFLRVVSSYTDGAGKLEAVYSPSSLKIANVNDLPTGVLSISGSATQNQTLNVINSLRDDDGLGAFSYQWKANGVNIAGATSTSYRLTQAEVGKNITVTVGYTDALGSVESVTSLATARVSNVNDTPLGIVSISGVNEEGNVLTASNSLSDLDGMGTVSYQWFASGVAIAGATSASFTLTSAQVGKAMTVQARYLDGQGTTETVTSANTDSVIALVVRHIGAPLTGSKAGSAGNDLFSATIDKSALSNAIDHFNVIDLTGTNSVVAKNLNSGAYFASAIKNSDLNLGGGAVNVLAEISGGYYPVAISGSKLTSGAGDSLTTVSVTGAIYGATGVGDSVFNLGAGIDQLDIEVTWNTPSWPLLGVNNSTLNFGDGNDVFNIKFNNNTLSLSSWAIQGGNVDMGSGNDAITINAVQGIKGSTIQGGDGDDVIEINSTSIGIKDSSVSLGAGNDRIVLKESGTNTISADNVTFDLGSGDDFLQLTRGKSTVMGGEGRDILAIAGMSSNFTFSFKGTDLLVSAKNDPFTVFTTSDVETIQFNNQSIDTKSLTAVTVTPSVTNVNEGGKVVFNVSTSGIAVGSVLPYTISGNNISAKDISSEILSGTLTVGQDGKASLAVDVVSDNLTEGVETMVVSVNGKTASVTINDTSTGTVSTKLAWADWKSYDGSKSTANVQTANGTISATLTTSTPIVGIQIDNALSDNLPHTYDWRPGGVDYWTPENGLFGSINKPTNTDIVQFSSAGTRTLTFTENVGDLYLAVLSINDNVYRFDRNFELITSTNNGMWGSGSVSKRIVTEAGKTFYELVAVAGDAGGLLKFADVSKTLSWTARVDENWNAITFGVVAPTATLYEGSPLTGSMAGTEGADTYIGTTSSNTMSYAIDHLNVIDMAGANTVKATNLNTNSYFAAAITNSNLVLGEDAVNVNAEISGGYYPVGIDNSKLTYGAGDSQTTVKVTGAIYGASGLNNTAIDFGSGADQMDVTVTWNTTSGSLIGLHNSNLKFGDGIDRLDVKLANTSLELTSWAIQGGSVDMGTGADSITINAVQGVRGASILGGDGNDTLTINSVSIGIKDANIAMGQGNDTITLKESGASAISVTNSTIDMGAGDDQLSLARGTATLIGGEGTDTVTIAGLSTNYNIQSQGTDKIITAKNDPFTVFTVKQFEVAKFTDKEIKLVDENNPPKGTISVSGDPVQGSTLTATSTLSDADGLGTFTYQWRAGGANISGATSSTFTVTQDQVGLPISVSVSYIDQKGFSENVLSAATAKVQGIFNISGPSTVNEGETASFVVTAVDANPGKFTAAGKFGVQIAYSGDAPVVYKATFKPSNGEEVDVTKFVSIEQPFLYAGLNGYMTLKVASGANIANRDVFVDVKGSVNPWNAVWLDITAAANNTFTVAASSDSSAVSSVSAVIAASNADVGGTVVAYTLSGVNAADIASGQTTGTVTLGKDGKGTFTVGLVADSATEGTENMVVSVRGQSANVSVADTSKANAAPTGTVSISGTATQGQTLTVNQNLGDADGLGAISYQWKANGINLAGATGTTLVLTEALVDQTISVVASYTDGLQKSESVSSAATAKVANVNDAPKGSVTISGVSTQKEILTVTNNLSDDDGLGSIAYQWLADNIAISGATSSSFELGQEQVGKAISVKASYTDGRGTAEAETSSATAKVVDVNDAPVGNVTIEGTAKQSEKLTLSQNLSDQDGMGALSYQWLSNGKVIEGATGTSLTLTKALVGTAISATVSYTDQQKNPESVSSSATAPVVGLPGDTVGGQIYHWKNHALLSGTQVQMASVTGNTSNTTRLFEFKDITFSSNNQVTANLFINLSQATENFDMSLSFDRSINLLFTALETALPTGWTLQAEASEPGSLKLAGIGLTSVNGSINLGTVKFGLSADSPAASLQFVDGSSGGNTTAANKVLTPYAMSVGYQSALTDASGAFTFEQLPSNTYTMSASRAITAAETGNAISSADALAALKIAVGRNPNVDAIALSPYQLIAADVNADGKVTSADALAILKMAVKRSDAPAREWLFVDEAQDFWDEAANNGAGGLTISRTNVQYNKNLELVSSDTSNKDLIAVLKGDVNGSWTAPNTPTPVKNLPDSYFYDLQKQGLGPVSNWGIVMA